MVDETFAAHYWPGENAIGKRVNVGGPDAPWATVVGVAARVRRDGPRHTGEPQVYVPYFQSRIRTMNVIVRTDGNASHAAGALRRVVSNLDAQLPVAQLVDVEELAARVTAADRFNLLLVVSFAGCALLLAGVGLYGVISYIVTQSTREIGIRIALGSTQTALIRRLIVRAGTLDVFGGGSRAVCRRGRQPGALVAAVPGQPRGRENVRDGGCRNLRDCARFHLSSRPENHPPRSRGRDQSLIASP